MKKTKIISTIGPASSKREVLKEMILEGVNVCRLNFSHGTYDQHLAAIELIRSLNDELNLNTAILVDLQGPKIRVDEVENNGILLEKGHIITVSTDKCIGNSSHISINYKDLPKDVKIGEKIVLDDGKLSLEVVDTNGVDKISCKVIHGGILSSRKGVNLPNTNISLPSLTVKDRADLEFALLHNVDWVGLSFVRNAREIIE